MSKQWFLIKSLGTTVDLSLVSQVVWNYKSSDRRIYTEIYFGTNIAYDPNTSGLEGNKWWVYDPDDRKNLQAALVALSLPTVELIFNERGNQLPKPEKQHPQLAF